MLTWVRVAVTDVDAQALKLGISQGINRIRTGDKIVPNDGDFLFEHKEALQLPPTLGLPQGAQVQWKDYCPFVFRWLSRAKAVARGQRPCDVPPAAATTAVCGWCHVSDAFAGTSGRNWASTRDSS